MLLSLLLSAASLVAASVEDAANLAPKTFDWYAIVPSEQLKYQNCYDGFKCARLVVPLDWKNPEDNHTVAIAMIKLPAVVPENDAAFGGTIIFNPGGPGVSGVNAALQGARTIQQNLADKPGLRHYEILSFDPRGVGRTTPASDCFRSDPLGRTSWMIEDRAKGPLSYGKPTQSYGLGLVKNFAEQCKLDEEFKGSMEYVNTPSVARDMVEMIDRIDELRKREAGQNQGKPPGPQRLPGFQSEVERDEDGQAQESPKTQLHQRGKTDNQEEDENNPVPRIQYLGFSYGTILGNTFASMFPGRVGRMVLDGVHDAKDYYTGDSSTALEDTEEMFDTFLRGCYDAKVSKCPFRLSYKTPEEAKKRFWEWIIHLNRFPLSVNPVKGGIKVVRGSDVLAAVGSALYSPFQKFQPLALGLYDGMSVGDLNRLADFINEDSPKIADAVSSDSLQPKAEQTWGVTCSDGPDWRGRDVNFWDRHLQKLEMKSRFFGPFWTNVRFACASWPFRPNWEFSGPFKTPAPSSEPLYTAKPAAPLLFLSSRYDPVAPLKAARAMAKEHPDSGVLVQQSMGHTTWGGGPSRCTWDAVRDYFYLGKVQASEYSCPAECDPWENDCEKTLAKRADGEGRSWDAWKNMTGALRESLRPRPWAVGGP
ncbi:TAP-like domain-containing protein [Trichoderma velutinum]